MAVLVDPRLAACGLATFQSFFDQDHLEVISGHPSRNVARFELGSWRGFLKRQHWIPWKDYFESWWAGFGFVDRSQREWNTLVALRQNGIACPEPLAVGSNQGRSFLLVREIAGAVDLHTYLLAHCVAPRDRRRFAASLGRTLAHFHAGGFTQPDLYAKHVFIRIADGVITLIDFQRTRWHRRVPWRSRWRDLAALDASLGEHLISSADRLRLLKVYLKEAGATGWLRQATRAIQRRTRYLLSRRKIQAMRHPWRLEPGARQIEYVRVRFDPAAEEVKGAAP